MNKVEIPGIAALSASYAQLQRRWVGSPAQRAVTWWLHTLYALLPFALQQRLAIGKHEACIEWHDDAMVWPQSQQPLKLMLPSEVVLVRTLSLPAAAARNCHEVIGFELDKYTPYPSSRVYFATRLLAVDATRARVCLVIILRERLDAILQQAAHAGMSLDAIDVRDKQGEAWQVNLLPENVRLPRTNKQGRLLKTLSCSCVVLTFTLMALWLQQREQQVDDVQQQVEQQNQQVMKLTQLRQQLRDTRGAAFWLIHLKQASPTYSHVLADLTACVPANSWLDRLDIDARGKLTITGESAATSGLPADLRACKTLTTPRFQGVIQPDASSGKDQFTLTADIINRGDDAQNLHRP